MSLEVGINTGSGSIADVLAAEGYIFKKDFIVAACIETRAQRSGIPGGINQT